MLYSYSGGTNYHLLSVGAEFELNEKKYKIKEIRLLFHDNTIDMSNPPGASLNAVGELLDYNFEIGLFVKEI